MAPHSAMIRKASKRLGGGLFGHGGGVQRNASAITHNSPTMMTAATAGRYFGPLLGGVSAVLVVRHQGAFRD